MNYLKYIFLVLILTLVVGGVGFYFLQKTVSEPVSNQKIFSTPTATIPEKPPFSLEEAPSESLRGEIVIVTGEVNYLGRTATESAQVSSLGTKVQQGENYITGEDSILSINFKDACSILLGEKTEVDIIQTLPSNIVFSQITGTAQYINSGSYPISIRTSYLLTQLDGEAEISRDTDKSTIVVSVKSGNAVMAYNDLNYRSHIVNISEDQTYTFNYDTRKGVLK
jgi:hypothetical protein